MDQSTINASNLRRLLAPEYVQNRHRNAREGSRQGQPQMDNQFMAQHPHQQPATLQPQQPTAPEVTNHQPAPPPLRAASPTRPNVSQPPPGFQYFHNVNEAPIRPSHSSGPPNFAPRDASRHSHDYSRPPPSNFQPQRGFQQSFRPQNPVNRPFFLPTGGNPRFASFPFNNAQFSPFFNPSYPPPVNFNQQAFQRHVYQAQAENFLHQSAPRRRNFRCQPYNSNIIYPPMYSTQHLPNQSSRNESETCGQSSNGASTSGRFSEQNINAPPVVPGETDGKEGNSSNAEPGACGSHNPGLSSFTGNELGFMDVDLSTLEAIEKKNIAESLLRLQQIKAAQGVNPFRSETSIKQLPQNLPALPCVEQLLSSVAAPQNNMALATVVGSGSATDVVNELVSSGYAFGGDVYNPYVDSIASQGNAVMDYVCLAKTAEAAAFAAAAQAFTVTYDMALRPSTVVLRELSDSSSSDILDRPPPLIPIEDLEESRRMRPPATPTQPSTCESPMTMEMKMELQRQAFLRSPSDTSSAPSPISVRSHSVDSASAALQAAAAAAAQQNVLLEATVAAAAAPNDRRDPRCCGHKPSDVAEDLSAAAAAAAAAAATASAVPKRRRSRRAGEDPDVATTVQAQVQENAYPQIGPRIQGDDQTRQARLEAPSEEQTLWARLQAQAEGRRLQARLQAQAEELAQARTRAQARLQAQAKEQAQAQAQKQAQAQAQMQAQFHAQAKEQAQAREQAQMQARFHAQAKEQSQAQAREQAHVQPQFQAPVEDHAQAKFQSQVNAQILFKAVTEEQAQAQARIQARADQESQIQARLRSQVDAQTRLQAEEAHANMRNRIKVQTEVQRQAERHAQAQEQQHARVLAQGRIHPQVSPQDLAQIQAQIRAQQAKTLENQSKMEAQTNAQAEALARAQAKVQSEPRGSIPASGRRHVCAIPQPTRESSSRPPASLVGVGGPWSRTLTAPLMAGENYRAQPACALTSAAVTSTSTTTVTTAVSPPEAHHHHQESERFRGDVGSKGRRKI